MIIKERDDSKATYAELIQLLKLPNISDEQKFWIEREIKNLKKGEKGEKDSAYYLDFYFGDSESNKKADNWAVIHDLRLEVDNRVAQIDHLLINRFLEIYVLESKNFYNGITINESGEFSTHYKNRIYGIPSPLEQNDRHITVLKRLLNEEDILPKRIGLKIIPSFMSYVLISPDSTIKRPNNKFFNTQNIIKADTLKTVLYEEIKGFKPRLSDFTSMAKLVSSETLENFAYEIIYYHQPAKINWKKKFNINSQPVENLDNNKTSSLYKTSEYYCTKCEKGISHKVASFCWNNKSRFGGKAYCYNCQKSF